MKDATTDRATIRKWWDDWPEANIGIATGKVSGIVVLDIDTRHGGDKTLTTLRSELGPLKKSPRASTGGGGEHRLFRYPNFKVKSDTAGKTLGAGVDVLSDGSIMIAPPSIHASGKRYEWMEGRTPDDINLASLPKGWLTQLRAEQPQPPNPNGGGGARRHAKILEGARNTTLTALAGSLHRQGLSPAGLISVLRAANQSDCEPPLGEDEVTKIVASIEKYTDHPKETRSDDAERLTAAVLNEHFASGKHLLFGPDGQFWHYNGKFWDAVKDPWIKGRILESIEHQSFPTKQNTSSLLSQVLSLLTAKQSASNDPLAFVSEPSGVINCANGEVWIGNDGSINLHPHKPESYLRHCLDIEYDPKAKCPKYDDALLGIFGKSSKPKDMRRHWNEFAGYMIQPKRNIPLIVILLGDGENGKTVLLRTLIRLIGTKRVQTQRVDELQRNQFAMGDLVGKLMFLDDDVQAGARLPDGLLKTISEAKEITGQLKYRSSFGFIVRTVPVLLCNNVPSLADVSHGMRRRLMIIPFDRRFTKDDVDKTLFESIWASELPGVLNRVLAGYSRLRERGRFEYPADVDKAAENWLEQANPLPAFLNERCERISDASCWLKDLYREYREWATASGFTMIQNKLNFRRNIEHLEIKVSHGNLGNKVFGVVLK